MPTIKEVETAILTRVNNIKQKTKEKYVRKFKLIIKGCNDTNFIERFNDVEYIKNVYLKDKSPRTIITYIGDIMAINGSISLLEPENLKLLTQFRAIYTDILDNEKKEIETKRRVVAIKEEEINAVLDSDNIEVNDTSSETSSDYGFFHEEPDIIRNPLEEKKIAIQYEIESLEQRLNKLRNTLEILNEV